MEKKWETEDIMMDWECQGYKCALRRNNFGAWCGYVGIPESHPLHGLSYSHKSSITESAPEDHLDVHGGITYSNNSIYDNPTSEKTWWFGFDCGHCYDYQPYFSYSSENAVYRDQEYAKSETEKLAKQLREIEENINE